MPGFLTNVFDGGNGTQSSEGSQHLGVDEALDLNPSITVAHSESVEYQSLDGSSHSFSNSEDLTVDVGLHAMLAVAVDTAQGAFNGDGFEE